MTPAERETVIQFDSAGETAQVYTCHTRWQRHLRRLGLKPVAQDHGGETFEVPKSWLRLPRIPLVGSRKGRSMSRNSSIERSERDNSPSQGVGLPSEENDG
jgi:hypothetical protein